MAIALYGGSFDPIHIGHLITAQNVIENYDVEKVIFIPSHVTPLKNRELEASDEDRLKMTYISTKNNNKFLFHLCPLSYYLKKIISCINQCYKKLYHKTFPTSKCQRRTPSYRYLDYSPCVTWMVEFPYSLETDDKNHVGIAILDRYGELYFRNAPL